MPTTFSLSLELIMLMNWLLQNESEKLKILVEDTLKSGFLDELEKIDNLEDEEVDQFHESILDFMIFLEDTLLDALEKKEIDYKSREKLASTLQKVNPQNIDVKTMWSSLQQAKTQINKTNQQNDKKQMTNDEIKKTLFFQILKNWNPKNNDPVN